MKNKTLTIFGLAALLIASTPIFVGCNDEEEISKNETVAHKSATETKTFKLDVIVKDTDGVEWRIKGTVTVRFTLGVPIPCNVDVTMTNLKTGDSYSVNFTIRNYENGKIIDGFGEIINEEGRIMNPADFPHLNDILSEAIATVINE